MNLYRYDTFKNLYDLLPQKYRNVILQLLQNLEHTQNIEFDAINYKRGLRIAMLEQDYTFDSLAAHVQKTLNLKEAPRDSIASLIERGSKRSDYLHIVCDILEVDETFLINNSDYIHEHIHDMKWCFDTLSDQNKIAVCHLTYQLTILESLPIPSDLKATFKYVNIEPPPKEH